MSFDQLRGPPTPGGDDDRERAAALKHDLGKYVAWRSANLPDDAWRGTPGVELLEALRADLLHTRSGPEGSEAAWSIFARLAEGWPQPWPAELEAVEQAIASLRSHEDALARGDAAALAPALASIRTAQQTIRAELATLVRRLAREA